MEEHHAIDLLDTVSGTPPIEFCKANITQWVRLRLFDNTIVCFTFTNTTEIVKVWNIITIINSLIYSNRTMNETTTTPTGTITNKPRVNYDISDLFYYTLDGFLPEY